MADLSEDELRKILRAQVGYHNDVRVSAKDVAARYGVSQGYLSDVLNGKRGIADRLAGAMGYERTVTFRQKPLANTIQNGRGGHGE